MTTRPYPWKCAECKHKAVVPTTIAHTAQIRHEGEPHEVFVPDLPVHACQHCGAVAMGVEADHRVRAQLRDDLDLLQPAVIRANRLSRGLTQAELGLLLGFAGESVSRWERGVLQCRTTDNLLRAFFDLPAFRDYITSRKDVVSVHEQTEFDFGDATEFMLYGFDSYGQDLYIDPVIDPTPAPVSQFAKLPKAA
jgi:transcriptional regulator with XRE-family HTH domain